MMRVAFVTDKDTNEILGNSCEFNNVEDVDIALLTLESYQALYPNKRLYLRITAAIELVKVRTYALPDTFKFGQVIYLN